MSLWAAACAVPAERTFVHAGIAAFTFPAPGAVVPSRTPVKKPIRNAVTFATGFRLTRNSVPKAPGSKNPAALPARRNPPLTTSLTNMPGTLFFPKNFTTNHPNKHEQKREKIWKQSYQTKISCGSWKSSQSAKNNPENQNMIHPVRVVCGCSLIQPSGVYKAPA
jgi:hypothetical protein